MPIMAYRLYGPKKIFRLPEQNYILFSLKILQKSSGSCHYQPKAGRLKPEIANAIEASANEVICGMFDKDFIVDGIQGGAGTSANMNMNEVIANRAIEMLCGKKGDYTIVHPNDHVNMAQSTNDVIPTAGN